MAALAMNLALHKGRPSCLSTLDLVRASLDADEWHLSCKVAVAGERRLSWAQVSITLSSSEAKTSKIHTTLVSPSLSLPTQGLQS